MKCKRIFCLLLTFVFLLSTATAQQRGEVQTTLQKINAYPETLGAGIAEFSATEYTKFHLHARRRNRLIDLLPSLFKLRWGEQDYLAEAQHELHYAAPNTWTKKAVAIVGTLPRISEIQHLANNYFNVSVYGRTLIEDRLLSPLHPRNQSYYYYQFEETSYAKGTMLRVRFKPKNHNPQLVRGNAWIDRRTGAVRRISFKGKYDIVDVEMSVNMGEDSLETLLPKEERIRARLNFCGNKLDGEYSLLYNYNEVKAADSVPAPTQGDKYDLTQHYSLELDSTAYKSNLQEFAPLRPEPLTKAEEDIYAANELAKAGKAAQPSAPARRSRVFWGAVGDALLDKHYLNLQQGGQFRFSPIITPTFLQYTPRRGFSLREDFRYSKLFPDGQMFRARVKIGYNFKQRQFLWSVPLSFEYWPKRRGLLTAEVGNGNHVNSSDLVEQLKHNVHGTLMPDSLANIIDGLNLGLYSDFYTTLNNQIDLTNGLTLGLGFAYHHRTLVNKRNVGVAAELGSGRIQKRYDSFAPHISLTYTPALYYYMNGRRKQTLTSRYPTFSANYERGIKLGNCKMEYSRWEFGTEYRLKLWELRSLWFRAGGGFYDHTKNTYFVDFANFKYRSLPEGWEDDLSGQFQLLSSQFYNSSNYYARACFTYESPMMMLTRIKYLTNYIQTERLYLNTLAVERLHPYVEAGYGIGTMIFNAGAYVSFANGKFDAVGFKLTFELFN